jgi:hypothetical protein
MPYSISDDLAAGSGIPTGDQSSENHFRRPLRAPLPPLAQETEGRTATLSRLGKHSYSGLLLRVAFFTSAAESRVSIFKRMETNRQKSMDTLHDCMRSARARGVPMKRSLISSLVLTAFICVAGDASAQSATPRPMQPDGRTMFMNGTTLLDACQKAGDAFCLGYVDGIADAINNSPTSIYRPDRSIALVCTTTAITGRQLVDVVVRFVQQHPEIRHNAAANLVAAALSDAFPCETR